MNDSQISEIKQNIQLIISRVHEYARKVYKDVTDTVIGANILLNESIKNKHSEAVKLSRKISSKIILIQSQLYSIQKINLIKTELKNIAESVDMKTTAAKNEIWSLITLPNYWLTTLKRLHYSRLLEPEQRVENLPDSPAEAERRGFVKLKEKESIYHMHKGQRGNMKYIHYTTGQEVIFNKHGKIVLDIENIGTKNYGPDPYTKRHIMYDVLPYWIWGNSAEDKTPLWNRMRGPAK